MRPRAHAVVLGLLLAVGMLVVDPSGWSPFGPARWAAVLVVLGTAAALCLRSGVRVARGPGLVWLVFLIWVVVAAAAGLDGVYAWVGTPQRHFGALTWGLCALAFVLGHSLEDDADGRLVIGAAALTAGAAGAWAVAEEIGWQPIALAGSDRLVGSLGNADYLGAAMALLGPISVGIALDRSWRVRWRITAGVSAALAGGALVGSGARGAWVGALTALVVSGWVWRRLLRSHWRRIAPAVAVVSLAVVVVAFATGVAGRVPAAFEDHGAGGASRLAEWRVAVRVVAAHPVTGTGPEGYRIAFGAAVDGSYQRTYGRSPLPDRAHDVILDVATTVGVPGAVVYLLLVSVVGLGMVRFVRRGPPPWLAGIVFGLLAYGVAELFLFPIAEFEPGVWLLAGLVTVYATGPDGLVQLRVPRPVAFVAVGLAALAFFFGIGDVRADRAAKASLAALAEGNLAAARTSAGRAVAGDPDDIALRLVAAEVDATSDNPAGIEAALVQVTAALRVSPADPVAGDTRAQLLVQLAQLREQPADWASARQDLAALVIQDPLNPQLWLDLGVVDAATDHDTAAARAWRSTAALDPGSAAPWTDLAVMDLGAGRIAASISAAHAALTRNPNATEAQAALARAETEESPPGSKSRRGGNLAGR